MASLQMLWLFFYRQRFVDAFVPRKAVFADFCEERIRVEFFHVEHACALPLAGEDHLGTEHAGYAGGVGDGLRAHFLETFGMVAVVPNVLGAFLAVLDAAHLAADGGLSLIAFAQR